MTPLATWADMFWEIPAEQIFESVQWIFGMIAKKQCTKVDTVCFSIFKESKYLDRAETAANKSFFQVTAPQIERFVRFDCEDNVLLVIGELVLKQGLRGVPINGFI